MPASDLHKQVQVFMCTCTTHRKGKKAGRNTERGWVYKVKKIKNLELETKVEDYKRRIIRGSI